MQTIKKYHLIALLCIGLLQQSCFKNTIAHLPKLIPINDSTWICENEVSISEWIEFIYKNKMDSANFPDEEAIKNFRYKGIYKVMQSDSVLYFSRQKDYLAVRRKMEEFYNTVGFTISPSTPITGISYKQVQQFLLWKAAQANTKLSDKEKIVLVLPDKSVYEKLIENVDSQNVATSDACMAYQFNYKHELCDKPEENPKNIYHPGVTLILPEYYKPTSLGLQNLQGNAAEMLNVEGLAAGGSFMHPANMSYKGQYLAYTKPEPWLGFRYLVKKIHHK